jgi:hypothetical protein
VSGGPVDLFAYLGRAERERLDRFAVRFDAIGASEYSLFVGPSRPDAKLEAAMQVALGELGSGRRHDAIKAAVDRFREAALQKYADRWGLPALYAAAQIAPSTAADRAQLFGSLERAVAALILWDRLDDETRVALAGPWAELVEGSIA